MYNIIFNNLLFASSRLNWAILDKFRNFPQIVCYDFSLLTIWAINQYAAGHEKKPGPIAPGK